jgi:hypothetical protein
MKSPLPTKTEDVSARLDKHPQLRQRVERLLDLCEDRAGDLRKADEAEQRVVEEMRALGHEVLEGWAREQLEARCEELDRTAGVSREGKKNSAGIPSSGTSQSRSHSTGKGPGGGAR